MLPVKEKNNVLPQYMLEVNHFVLSDEIFTVVLTFILPQQ